MMDDNDCSHLDQMHEVQASTDGCEDCLKIGDLLDAFAAVHGVRPRGML